MKCKVFFTASNATAYGTVCKESALQLGPVGLARLTGLVLCLQSQGNLTFPAMDEHALDLYIYVRRLKVASQMLPTKRWVWRQQK